MIDYVIFASGGNDSVALVRLARKYGLKNVAVAYSNTD
jgi:tRNA(Ile)-lysidine synthase TilS/MesJ